MSVKQSISIINEEGLHFRAWLKLVRAASRYVSEVRITRLGVSVDAKEMGSLVRLLRGAGEVHCGGVIEIEATGCDAEEAVKALCEQVENRFGEER
jgi:phosphocarrier protein